MSTVVDADRTADLLERPAVYATATGAGMLVLAYRDVSPALARLGFLPLDVQIDVWLSVMRLLLCGVVVYPQALLPGAPPEPPDGDLVLGPGGGRRGASVSGG